VPIAERTALKTTTSRLISIPLAWPINQAEFY
jgi:hypothetical protein